MCYTSAEGMLLGSCDHAGLSMPQIPSSWLYPAFSQAVDLYIPAAEVYPSLSVSGWQSLPPQLVTLPLTCLELPLV